MKNSRYEESIKHLTRAQETIPLGSQTFSKSRTQYPVGISPLYLDRGKGAYVWDLDGNKYLDLVNGLASITIGYGDKEIESAVRKQLKKGVSLSLPGVLEAEVSELIVEMVPSAEMVRFGKNGTDATSAAIRLARAYTGRDHVAVCGYHGWQDWYIGSTTRNKGVPETVSALTHKFEYNNIESLKRIVSENKDKIAAVIMEPMNVEFPLPGYLEEIKSITHKAGALLVFDETITGFRFSNGGAQEYFNVIPDLSTFGKGMANGFPLSAVVGRRDVMLEMEEIFFSGTFGGELLSLAAAKVVLNRYREAPVCKTLSEQGATLTSLIDPLIKEYGLTNILRFSGHPSWQFLNWTGTEKFNTSVIRTFFMQEMFVRGCLILGTHNISLAHNANKLGKIVLAYEGALRRLSKALENDSVKNELKVPPLIPLFKVR